MRQCPENYAVRYYQPKIGHGAVGIFLGGVKFIETFECSSSGAQEQTVVLLHLHTLPTVANQRTGDTSHELANPAIASKFISRYDMSKGLDCC